MDFDFEKMTNEEIMDFLRGIGNEEGAFADDPAAAANAALEAARTAADRGNAEAQFLYAGMLLRMPGVERDEKTAGQYMARAAEQGYPPALCHMGIFAQTGTCGFETDLAKAVDFFMLAAQMGNPDAMVHLYGTYSAGMGVARDKAKALAYLQSAVDAEYPPALLVMGAEFMSDPDGSPDKKRQGAALFLKAAEKGDPMAQLMYGTCCEQGIGAEKNLSEAAGWYRRAAKAGSVQANEALKKLGFPGVM